MKKKKIIIVPLAAGALGILSGCGGIAPTPSVTTESKFFTNYIDESKEAYFNVPSTAKIIDNNTTKIVLKEAEENTIEATKIQYDYLYGAVMDSSITMMNIDNPSNALYSGHEYKHFSTSSGEYKLNYDNDENPVMQETTQDKDYTLISNKYRTDYVDESIDSLYFANEGDITGEYALYSKNTASDFDRKGKLYFDKPNWSSVEGKTGKTDINDAIKDEFTSQHSTFKGEAFSEYSKLSEVVDKYKDIVPCKKEAKMSEDKNTVYCYLYCNDPIEDVSDTYISSIINSSTLGLTEEQKAELNGIITEKGGQGITYVINPLNAFSLNDLSQVHKVKANHKSIFDYYLPIYKSREMLLTLKKSDAKYYISSAATKYSNYLLKNENGKLLENPITYKTSYNYCNFDYSELEKIEPLTKGELINYPHTVNSTCFVQAHDSLLRDVSLFDDTEEEYLKDGAHVYEGYLSKTSDHFGIITTTTSQTNKGLGYNAITGCNIDGWEDMLRYSGTEVDPLFPTTGANINRSIQWPEGYNEVYIICYVKTDGTIYTKDGKYGLLLDFIPGNAAYEG